MSEQETNQPSSVRQNDTNQDNSSSGSEAEEAGVTQVSNSEKTVKVPQFWPANPKRWFTRVEARFRASNIKKESKKFDAVLDALDDEHLEELDDELTDEPRLGHEYEDLKAALLEAFGKKDTQRNAELFALTSMGDKSARSTFRKIRRLTTSLNQIQSALLLSLAPPDVRPIVAAREFEDGKELADVLDRIQESRSMVPGLPQPINAVSEEFEAMAIGNKKKKRPFGKYTKKKNKNESDSREEGDASSFVCDKHLKYGVKAFSCEPGCLFASLIPEHKQKKSN